MATKETSYWPYNAIFACMKFHADQYYSDGIPPLEGAGGAKASEIDGKLWSASDRGDVERVKILVKEGADMNFQHASGTPLIRAARRGHQLCVETLLDLGADVNVAGRHNCRSCTALHAAAAGGHTDIVRLLLDRGADINATDSDGGTALHDAARFGHLTVVRTLLSGGAHVNTQNNAGASALFLAICYGHVDGLRWVLEAVVDYYHFEGYYYNADLFPRDAVERVFREWEKVCALNLSELHILRQALPSGDVTSVMGPVPDNYKYRYYGYRWQKSVENKPLTEVRLQLIRTLLDAGAEVDLQDGNGTSPLMEALFDKDVCAARLLLDHGADVNKMSDKYGSRCCPLHLAAGCYGNADVVRLLLQEGADIRARDENMRTALHCAAHEGDVERVRILLEHGADVKAVDNAGCTPLHEALVVGVAKLLVDHGADVKAVTQRGETVLFRASGRGGEGECVRYLISQGADPLARDVDNKSPLDLAVCRSYYKSEYDGDEEGLECTKVLMEHGARLDKMDLTLQQAVRRRWFGYVYALFREGDPAAILLDPSNKALVFKAVECHCSPGIAMLIQEGANPNEASGGMTPLDLALRVTRDVQCARVLLDNGARINNAFKCKKKLEDYFKVLKELSLLNIQDPEGTTITHMACLEPRSSGLLTQLLESGVDVNIADSQGITPLHILAYRGAEDQVTALLDVGADHNKQDCAGWAPLHWATYHGRTKMAALLLEHGADPNQQDTVGRTALHVAAHGDSCKLLDALLVLGAAVDKTDSRGWSPLHVAALQGHLGVMQMLVDRSADVNAVTEDGVTTLQICELQEHEDCVGWLLDNGARRGSSEVRQLHCEALNVKRRLLPQDLVLSAFDIDINDDSEEEDLGFGLFD